MGDIPMLFYYTALSILQMIYPLNAGTKSKQERNRQRTKHSKSVTFVTFYEKRKYLLYLVTLSVS